MDVDWKQAALLITATWLTVDFACAVSRVFFHPLSKYPGPKLAAASFYYRKYYDLIKGGEWTNQVKLHEEYGPVVRVGPNSLHFNTADAYSDIYAAGSTFTKDPIVYKCLVQDEALLSYMDPELHRARRVVLNPLFSRQSILNQEALSARKIKGFVQKLGGYAGSGKVIDLYLALRCLTIDIIAEFCFAGDLKAVEAPDSQDPYILAGQQLAHSVWLVSHFSLFHKLLTLPDWLSGALFPVTRPLIEVRQRMAEQINRFLSDPNALEKADHEIIYHHLLVTSEKGSRNHFPSKKSLLDEAQILTLAGSDTVAGTSTVGFFHLLRTPAARAKLVTELRDAFPDADPVLDIHTLEKLPYLNACIKEALRLSMGAITPLMRIVGPGDAIVNGHAIPAGTSVGVGAWFMHMNPEVFPNPTQYQPERWLSPKAVELERYLVPFSRGPRACIGINLAKHELCVIFATFWRFWDVEMTGTPGVVFVAPLLTDPSNLYSRTDALDFKDYFIPVPKAHLKVKVKAIKQ